ncbi:MAG: bifunctional phosphoribosylaminoimidazolecarboxamide formyltransferase/IMP cyclohydrolase [Chitinophagaceae bacterium]
MNKKISSALISVFYKDGLEPVVKELRKRNITIYSTGGTENFIKQLGIDVIPVENLTSFPSVLGGRIKTLHPLVFGGILGRRNNEKDVQEMQQYNIPEIDLVIVDLYPVEDTIAKHNSRLDAEDEEEIAIIEKIDIGGLSMVRAAAKNFTDITVIVSKNDYKPLTELLQQQNGTLTLEQRRSFAAKAFKVIAEYDIAISNYFNRTTPLTVSEDKTILRYGENPHQQATFIGSLEQHFIKLNGKPLSYNNLVDVDAAIELIREFSPSLTLPEGKGHPPHNTALNEGAQMVSPAGGACLPDRQGWEGAATFAIIKHTNVCGIACRTTVRDAWKSALQGDPESAFGGVLICNGEIDVTTASAINELFFEVLIATSFSKEALQILRSKKNRIILQLKNLPQTKQSHKSVLDGSLAQQRDQGNYKKWEEVGGRNSTEQEKDDLLFANIICKHLKSNAIAVVKNKQLIGKGCGQTSRIDAVRQAIEKAKQFNFDLRSAVMASDAFFPFHDSVQIGYQAGITAFIQPGGSVRDKDSIEYCKQNNLAMVFTGMRHFKH